MEQSEFIRFVIEAFERLGIAYLVTGSVASSIYGEPRFTNNVNVLVHLTPEQVEPLLQSFPEVDFYVSRSAAEDAVRRRKQFNIIHPATGLKADVIVETGSEFDRARSPASGPLEASHHVRFA